MTHRRSSMAVASMCHRQPPVNELMRTRNIIQIFRYKMRTNLHTRTHTHIHTHTHTHVYLQTWITYEQTGAKHRTEKHTPIPCRNIEERICQIPGTRHANEQLLHTKKRRRIYEILGTRETCADNVQKNKRNIVKHNGGKPVRQSALT